MAMVAEVLDLVEVARIELEKPDGAAGPLVEPARSEDGSMAQLMLCAIKPIEQDALNQEARHHPPGAPQGCQQRRRDGESQQVARKLRGAADIGSCAQGLQLLPGQQIAATNEAVHGFRLLSRCR